MKLLLAIVCKLLLFENALNTILYYGLSEYEKMEIVDKHNQLRLMLQQEQINGQPKAKTMKIIKYDQNLSYAAQNISNTCTFQHVQVEDERWWYVGQNLYMYMTSVSTYTVTWTDVIQIWFDEHWKYQYPDGANYQTAHYTQVVWAKTEYIGCGYTMFIKYPLLTLNHIYVCNYGPGGNIEGVPPYRID